MAGTALKSRTIHTMTSKPLRALRTQERRGSVSPPKVKAVPSATAIAARPSRSQSAAIWNINDRLSSTACGRPWGDTGGRSIGEQGSSPLPLPRVASAGISVELGEREICPTPYPRGFREDPTLEPPDDDFGAAYGDGPIGERCHRPGIPDRSAGTLTRGELSLDEIAAIVIFDGVDVATAEGQVVDEPDLALGCCVEGWNLES